jgi:hypothetical protein
MSSPLGGDEVELGDSALVAKGASRTDTIQKPFQKTTFDETGQYDKQRMHPEKRIRPLAKGMCTGTAKGAIYSRRRNRLKAGDFLIVKT